MICGKAGSERKRELWMMKEGMQNEEVEITS